MNREAHILAALPSASPREQRVLMAELDRLRAARREVALADREGARVAGLLRQPSAPAASIHHTAATAWLGDVDTAHQGNVHQAAKAEATRWLRQVASFVLEDHHEFTVQARGAAQVVASTFGPAAREAEAAFLQQVSHLSKIHVANEMMGYDDPMNPGTRSYPTGETAPGDDSMMDSSDPSADMSDKAMASLGETDAAKKCGACGGSGYESKSGKKCGACGGPGGKRKSSTRRVTAARPLYEIADEIRRDWQNVNYGAVPYLDAMESLNSINDAFYQDSAKSIVAYFLSNASSWRGETAKRIKAELKAMMNGTTASRKVAALPTAIAGANAYCTNPTNSAIRETVAPGTVATAVQKYVTAMGTSTYDWEVQGLDGTWSLGGDWTMAATASRRRAAFGYEEGNDPGEGPSSGTTTRCQYCDQGLTKSDRDMGGFGDICAECRDGLDREASFRVMERSASRRVAERDGEDDGPAEDDVPRWVRDDEDDKNYWNFDAEDDDGDKTASFRRHADEGFGPSAESQSGDAETALPNVEVMDALDNFNLGWIEGDMADPEGAYDMADDGIGPFDASLRQAAMSAADFPTAVADEGAIIYNRNEYGNQRTVTAGTRAYAVGFSVEGGGIYDWEVEGLPGVWNLSDNWRISASASRRTAADNDRSMVDCWECGKPFLTATKPGQKEEDFVCRDCKSKKSSRRTAAEVTRHEDGSSSWKCNRCSAKVMRYRGESDVSCDKCGAEYNAFGQQLRDNWRNNPSSWDEDISDMEGYEMEMGRYESSRRQAMEYQPGWGYDANDDGKPAGAAPQVPTIGLDDSAMFEPTEIEGGWDMSEEESTKITSSIDITNVSVFDF